MRGIKNSESEFKKWTDSSPQAKEITGVETLVLQEYHPEHSESRTYSHLNEFQKG